MRQFLMLLLLAIVGLVLIPQVAPAPKYASKKETVAMSAIEYSRKWEPFLGHRRSLVDDKDWNNLHDAYKSFHENNDVIITGHVVKIPRKEAGYGSEVLSIYLEGIDSTNEYGFKCNVYLEVDGDMGDLGPVGFLSGIPQEQIQWIQIGDIVSVSYEGPGGAEFKGGMFCVNHNDWNNQKSEKILVLIPDYTRLFVNIRRKLFTTRTVSKVGGKKMQLMRNPRFIELLNITQFLMIGKRQNQCNENWLKRFGDNTRTGWFQCAEIIVKRSLKQNLTVGT